MPIADSQRIVDFIAPDYIEEARIDLSLPDAAAPKANQPITIAFDYTRAGEAGVMPPLELVVQPCFLEGGEASGYQRKVFRRLIPENHLFNFPSAGQYLVLLREMFHNQFFGKRLVEVAGDSVESIRLTRR
mgnify:CR=1 FL=1